MNSIYIHNRIYYNNYTKRVEFPGPWGISRKSRVRFLALRGLGWRTDRISEMLRSVFKFHVCFCGLDSGNLKFETVRTNKQHICFWDLRRLI